MEDADTYLGHATTTLSQKRHASSTRHEPEQLKRFVWLSLLRAYGVVLVLIYHFYPRIVPAGFLGVDVFFVFSGYLISSLLIKESLTTGHIDLIGFYRRRVRRLLPALLFMLLIMLPLSLLISPDFRVGIARQAAAALGWVTNFYEIAQGQSYADSLLPHLFIHTWTLSIEMQYYLLWGALLCVMLPASALMVRKRQNRASHRSSAQTNRHRLSVGANHSPMSADQLPVGTRRLRVIILIALTGALLSFVAMWLLLMNTDDPSPAYFNTLSHLYPLLIGSAVGVAAGFPHSFLVRLAKRVHPAIAIAITALCLLGITAMALLLSFEDPLTYHMGILLTSVLVAVVIILGRGGQDRLARYAEPRLPLYLANASYSLYLFHWPLYIIIGQWGQGFARGAPEGFASLIVNIVTILALALTFVFAHLSYRLVEQPFSVGGQGLSQSGAAWRAMLENLASRPAVRVILQLASRPPALLASWLTSRLSRSRRLPRLTRRLPRLTWRPPPLLLVCLIALVLLTGCVRALWGAPAKTSIEQDYQRGTMALDISQLNKAYATIDQLTQAGTNDEGSSALVSENVTIIGDSVTLDAAAPLQEATGAYIDASVGRSMRQGVSLMTEREQSGELREYVVVALATNTHADSLDAAYEIIANMTPGHRLIFVTSYGVDNHDMDELSAALRALPNEFPFVTIADWNSAIAGKESLLAPDGYHCADPESVDIYTQTVLDALREASVKPTT